MKKVRGIVLEVGKKHIILLTPAGDYQKVPHPGGDIRRGEELIYRLPLAARPKTVGALALLAAAALLLIAIIPSVLLVTTDLSDSDSPETGYLILDINPSLELTFNEDHEVTAFHPLNDDAVMLLEGVDVGAGLFSTVDLLLERSAELGFLDPGESDNLVLITLVRPGEADISLKLLADNIEQKLSQIGIPGSVGLFEAKGIERDKAREAGVSLNRYLLIEALQVQGVEIAGSKDQSAVNLLSLLHNKLPFSEFRTSVVPELPPQVPFNVEDLPGPPELPVDLPELPEQAENRSDNKPVLPTPPVTVPFVSVENPGSPGL
jgi:hypothetical protein